MFDFGGKQIPKVSESLIQSIGVQGTFFGFECAAKKCDNWTTVHGIDANFPH